MSRFRDLIFPLSQHQFLRNLSQRKLAFYPNKIGPGINELINFNSIFEIIKAGKLPVGITSVTKNQTPILQFMYSKDSYLEPDKIEKIINSGGSLILDPAQEQFPNLKDICDDLTLVTQEKVNAAVIITTGNGGAFPPHTDAMDLIIIQVEGSKQWKIYDPPISHPYVAKQKAKRQNFDEFLQYGSLIFDEEIQRRDFLFVPAGYWHHCENRSDRSIHVALAIDPPTAFSVITELLKDYLREDPFCLPLSRIDDREEKDKFISKITCELAEKFKNIVYGSEQAP